MSEEILLHLNETKEQKLKRRKREISWILYDCANSAYSMTVDTALFPIYYAMADNANALALGYYKSLAGLIVALISPVLGSIADYKGQKKKFFTFFNTLSIIFTALLGIVDNPDFRFLAIIYILSDITWAACNIFYDAFLVDVADERRMDLVSARGFAYGYIASVLPFLLCLIAVQLGGIQNSFGYRFSFIITSIWWWALSIPMYKNVHQLYYISPEKTPIRNSFKRLFSTLKSIANYKVIAVFLLSYFFYIDGVNTIIRMVVPFAQSVIGKDKFDTMILLGILLIIQVVAFPCALIFGRLASRFGTMNMIRIAILIYIFVTVSAIFISSMFHVFVLSMMVALVQGGIQALSRSYFAKIIPKEKSNEFFGFYNIFGKFAAIMGPFLISFIDSLTGQPRFTLLGIVPLFLVGFFVSLALPKEN